MASDLRTDLLRFTILVRTSSYILHYFPLIALLVLQQDATGNVLYKLLTLLLCVMPCYYVETDYDDDDESTPVWPTWAVDVETYNCGRMTRQVACLPISGPRCRECHFPLVLYNTLSSLFLPSPCPVVLWPPGVLAA